MKTGNPWASKFDKTYQNGNKDLELLPQPEKLYAIAFTPRSGSTWLNDVLLRTHKIGKPKEWFNVGFPRLIKRIEKYKVNSIEEYYSLLKADKKTKNGVFGLQITWFQADLLFNYMNGNSIFDDINVWFWLKRKDFVAQGISLYKAVESGKFHSIDKTSSKEINYDDEKIKKWILHVLQQEYFFNQYFKEKNIQPSELWYENIMEDKRSTIKKIFACLNLDLPSNFEINLKSDYKKIGDKNTEFLIDRFKEDNTDFLNYWNKNRKLKKVGDYLKEAT